jgi:radical SAM family uncharacterized protein
MASWRLIQKAKDVLQKERGVVCKPWGGKISVCLLYPNHYFVGMSNLGFQTVYRSLNARDDVVCERAFLPELEDLQEYTQTQTSLFSLESQRPLSEFDIVAFSVSFENDFIHILTLLDLARIPLESQDRGNEFPLVIGGGVAVFLNPEPLSAFFDLFLLGEGEEMIPEFVEVFREAYAGKGRTEKKDLLRKLGQVEGVYVPGFYRVTYSDTNQIRSMEAEPGAAPRIRRRWVKEVDRFPTVTTLFTPDTEFKEMAVVEVNRGCPRRCRFCGACFVYHPYRNRSLAMVGSLSREALRKERRVGLAGTAVSDYPEIHALCQTIVDHQGSVSLSSMRVDTLTAPLVQCLKAGEVRTVAIAPEAGSERLRRVLGKGYTEAQILNAVTILAEQGLCQIKCYFMVGLPSETEEDVNAILHLAKRIRHQIVSTLKSKTQRWKVVLSVNPFIPKPATPFQWCAMEEVGALKNKIRMLQRGVKGERGLEVIYDLPKWAYVQALLSRGDRRVGKMLMSVHQNGGQWQKVFRETSLNPDFFVSRTRDLDEIFPWDFIDHGVSKETLKREYLKAMDEEDVKV